MAAFGSTSVGDEEEDGSAGLSSETGGPVGEAQAAQSYMTNTSTLDVTVPPPARLAPPSAPSPSPSPSPSSSSLSAARPAEPDAPASRAAAAFAYPRAFLDQVAPRAFQAVLEPGDVLVLPPRCVPLSLSLSLSPPPTSAPSGTRC